MKTHSTKLWIDDTHHGDHPSGEGAKQDSLDFFEEHTSKSAQQQVSEFQKLHEWGTTYCTAQQHSLTMTVHIFQLEEASQECLFNSNTSGSINNNLFANQQQSNNNNNIIESNSGKNTGQSGVAGDASGLAEGRKSVNTIGAKKIGGLGAKRVGCGVSRIISRHTHISALITLPQHLLLCSATLHRFYSLETINFAPYHRQKAYSLLCCSTCRILSFVLPLLLNIMWITTMEERMPPKLSGSQ